MFRICVIFFLVTSTFIGCGTGSNIGTLSLHVTRIEEDQDVGSVTFGIDKIMVSETGEAWAVICEDLEDLTIDSDARFELVHKEIPIGEYHGVRVELRPGVTFRLNDGTTLVRDYPDILMYRMNSGIYAYSNSGNGFPDTNQYWMFTTRNDAMSSPAEVEADETSFLVLSFKGKIRFTTPEETFLAAGINYTSFLY